MAPKGRKTLATVAEVGVDKFLGRSKARSVSAAARSQLLQDAAGILPRKTAANTPDCGADALDAGDGGDEETAELEAHEPDDALHIASGPYACEDDTGVSEDDEDWEQALASVPAPPADIEVNVNVAEGTGGSKRSERSTTAYERWFAKHGKAWVAKLRRQEAQALHRVNLLCLLGRAQLLNQAACHPLLQAVMLSLDKENLLGAARQRGALEREELPLVLVWFKALFCHAVEDVIVPSGENEGGDGVAAAVERLQAAAAEGRGTGEELVLLFVALLRAHGLLARCVWVLEPLPLRPRREAPAPPAKAKKSSADPVRKKPKAPPPRGASFKGDQAGPGPSSEAAAAAADGKVKGKQNGKRARKDRGAAAAAEGEASKADDGKAQESPGSWGWRRGHGSRAASHGRKRRVSKDPVGGGSPAKRREGRRRQSVPEDKAVKQDTESEADDADDLPLGKKPHLQAARVEAVHAPARWGDVEFENQLAMALQASAAATPGRMHGKALGGLQLGERREQRRADAPEAAAAFAAQAAAQLAKTAPQAAANSRGAAWARAEGRNVGGRCWAEVFCGDAASGRWLHVDPLLATMDRPGEVEGSAARDAPAAYIVAYGRDHVKDVTQRYVRDYQRLARHRDEEWWVATLAAQRALVLTKAQAQIAALAPTACPAANDPDAAAVAAAAVLGAALGGQGTVAVAMERPRGRSRGAGRGPAVAAGQDGPATVLEVTPGTEALRAAREDAELQQRAVAAQQDVPNTIPAFKSHPVYVLERHLTKYQALRPGAKRVGLHKGEAFFLRSEIAELHTAERWQREGRAVRPEELPAPVRTMAPRAALGTVKAFEEDKEGHGEAAAAAEEAAAAAGVLLYGRWQTAAWEPPVAAGGVVPKNNCGNVLCPPFAAALPQGTVHLTGMPRIGLTCKKLGVDYAAGMTGFDVRGGRSVPRIEGVVVCCEHRQAVLEAYWADQREAEVKAAAKRAAQAEADWRALLRAVLTRMRVHGAYAPGASETALDNAAELTSQKKLDVDLVEVVAPPSDRRPASIGGAATSDAGAAGSLANGHSGQAAGPTRARGHRKMDDAGSPPVAAEGDYDEGGYKVDGRASDREPLRQQRSQHGIMVDVENF